MYCLRFAMKFLFFFFVFLSETKGFSDFRPDSITLKLNTKEAGFNLRAESEEQSIRFWKIYCPLFANNLMVSAGPLGVGLFNTYQCRLDDRIVSGLSVKNSWQLQIEIIGEDLLFSLTYSGPEKINSSALKLSIATYKKQDLEKLFANEEFIKTVVVGLLNQLPAMGVMREKEFNELNNYVTPNVDLKILQNIKSLVFYELIYNGEAWQTQIYGTANRPTANEKQPGQSIWKLTKNKISPFLKHTEYVWFHDEAGPAALKLKAEKRLEEIAIMNEPRRGSTVFRNFVNLRYGLQILQGESLVKGARLIELNIQHALYERISARFEYQSILKNNISSDGNTSSFSSKKAALGLNGAIWKPNEIMDLNLSAKFGQSSFIAEVFLPDDFGNFSATQFDLSNLLASGIGANVELKWPSLYARFWYNFESANKGANKIRAQQLGVENIYRFGHGVEEAKFYQRFAISGFYLVERGRIESGDEDDAKNLTYQYAFLGFGLGLSL